MTHTCIFLYVFGREFQRTAFTFVFRQLQHLSKKSHFYLNLDLPPCRTLIKWKILNWELQSSHEQDQQNYVKIHGCISWMSQQKNIFLTSSWLNLQLIGSNHLEVQNEGMHAYVFRLALPTLWMIPLEFQLLIHPLVWYFQLILFIQLEPPAGWINLFCWDILQVQPFILLIFFIHTLLRINDDQSFCWLRNQDWGIKKVP